MSEVLTLNWVLDRTQKEETSEENTSEQLCSKGHYQEAQKQS